MKGWTFGAEFELSDWDRRKPCAWGLDERDVTMVNSNGIAVDPKGMLYHKGGEVLARPSDTANGVAAQFEVFMVMYPETTVNYRSNLHIHVRVPGLAQDLAMLKQLQMYCATWLPELLPLIEPIPAPMKADHPEPEAYRGARKRYARRKVSHQKIMPAEIVNRQMQARTVEEFIEAEALHVPTGKLMWAIRPRCAVNIRQLIQTDTIEFRHFPGTIDPMEVYGAVLWCGAFMHYAFYKEDPVKLWHNEYSHRPWPKFSPYVHWMEQRYLRTAAHLVGATAARAAIEEIERDGWDELALLRSSAIIEGVQ